MPFDNCATSKRASECIPPSGSTKEHSLAHFEVALGRGMGLQTRLTL